MVSVWPANVHIINYFYIYIIKFSKLCFDIRSFVHWVLIPYVVRGTCVTAVCRWGLPLYCVGGDIQHCTIQSSLQLHYPMRILCPWIYHLRLRCYADKRGLTKGRSHCRYSKMRGSVTNSYIVNLAVSDFCYLVGVPFVIVTAVRRQWIFGYVCCKLFYITTSLNWFTSVCLALLLCDIRWHSIKRRLSIIVIFYLRFTDCVTLCPLYSGCGRTLCLLQPIYQLNKQ